MIYFRSRQDYVGGRDASAKFRFSGQRTGEFRQSDGALAPSGVLYSYVFSRGLLGSRLGLSEKEVPHSLLHIQHRRF